MHDCVDTLDSRPLYFTKHDEAFTRLAVDYVAQYTVFFLASSKLQPTQIVRYFLVYIFSPCYNGFVRRSLYVLLIRLIYIYFYVSV